jgi:hypothetical protein
MYWNNRYYVVLLVIPDESGAGSLNVVNTTEELLGRKSSCSGLENRDYGRRGSAALTSRHSSISIKVH